MSCTSSLVYLNGSFVPREQAVVDIEDRGLMFADGVYEVLRYYDRTPFAVAEHLSRMRGSLEAIQIDFPDVDQFPAISDELIRRNDRPNATAYWQVTRGSARRNRAMPKNTTPTVFVITWPAPPLDALRALPSVKVIVAPDRRWHRCSIKSLMLLDNVLTKQLAAERGADDALYQRDNIITESTASNVFLVRRGALWTHPADDAILAGITRNIVLELARTLGITVYVHRFTTEDLRAADEVFLTGTSTHVTAVSHVDERPVPQSPGPVTRQLHAALLHHLVAACAQPHR